MGQLQAETMDECIRSDDGLTLRSDEGLTLETLTMKVFTMANLRYQLS